MLRKLPPKILQMVPQSSYSVSTTYTTTTPPPKINTFKENAKNFEKTHFLKILLFFRKVPISRNTHLTSILTRSIPTNLKK